MIYVFDCKCGREEEVSSSIKIGPPAHITCECGARMERVWNAPQILASGDPDDVPPQFRTMDVGGGVGPQGRPRRVTSGQVLGLSQAQATSRERQYQSFIEKRRKVFRESKQVGGRLTHQVPAELYHGKIKQTGDKDYWKDEGNLRKHQSCKVS